MKKIVLFVIVCFLVSCGSSEEVSKENRINNEEGIQEETALIQTEFIDSFSKSFKGTIDGRYEIIMNLQLSGEEIRGSYYYKKHNKSIELRGSFANVDNSFILDEFSKGEKTGTFSGEIDPEFNLSGFWTAFSKAPGRVESFSFELREVETDFVWYSPERPFHPYHVSLLLGLGDRDTEVDIRTSIEMPEGFSIYEDEGEFPSGFIIDYGDDFVMRMPYFKYDYLGKKDNLYFVSTSDCGGGTGIFSTITILQLDGITLSKVGSVCGGDRCNGGVTRLVKFIFLRT